MMRTYGSASTRVLNVVDRSFLIWLDHQDRDELLQELGVDGVVALAGP